MNLRRYAIVAVGVAAVLGAGWGGYRQFYASERDELLTKLAGYRAAVENYEAALKQGRTVRARLKEFAAGTLAGTDEQVEHRFRTDLNALAAHSGLKGIQVGNGRPEAIKSPVGESKMRGGLKALFRKQIDFYVMHGEVKGVGTLEQTLRTLAAVQSQPWIHRVESFSLKPDDKGRDRFELRLGVATVFFTDPELAPERVASPAHVEPDGRAQELVAAILDKNVFKEPPPVVLAQTTPPPPPPQQVVNVPPPPAPPPYSDWKLTGIVHGRVGLEAFMVNLKTGQRLTLDVGAAVADARFVAGTGERAVFEIAGQKFEIRNGQTLEQRRVLN